MYEFEQKACHMLACFGPKRAREYLRQHGYSTIRAFFVVWGMK